MEPTTLDQHSVFSSQCCNDHMHDEQCTHDAQCTHVKSKSKSKPKNKRKNKPKPKYGYNYESLMQLCEDTELVLTKSYENVKVNSKTEICAKCIRCKVKDMRPKPMGTLVVCLNFGCDDCYLAIQLERRGYNNSCTYEALMKLSQDNNAVLLIDYKDKKLNAKTIIKAKCTLCDNPMRKVTFYNLLEFQNFGCDDCWIIIQKNRHKQTCQDLYNCDNPMQVPEFKEKSVQTCQTLYNYDNPMQVPEFKEKHMRTIQTRYNCDYPLQVPEFKKKFIAYFQTNYGCDNPMQVPKFAENCLKSAFSRKDFEYPSGRIDKVQGYEPFALSDLLNLEHVDEDNIITNRIDVPKIWYESNDEKSHRYYVDIFIPEENRCIEIKSTWTFDNDKENVLLKQQAAIDAGYTCEIWVYDRKGNRIACY